MLMVDDYAYVGLDFRGDPDLVLPEDAQWGELGKKYTIFVLLDVFMNFIICKCFYFIFVQKLNTKSLLMTHMWDLTDLLALLPFNDKERWHQCHNGTLRIIK
jgi:hypothetical protein